MEVLNFFVERKSKLSSLCNCPLGQMSNIFVIRTPLAVVFLPCWKSNNLQTLLRFSFNLFKIFFFFFFFEQGKFKNSSWSRGKQILGVVPPLFPWNCLGQSPGFGASCRHLNRLIFGFFNFSFLRTREGRDEKIDQTSANSSDAILL